MSTQQKKPIAKASDAELRDFAELVLQLNAEGCGTRARLLALIRPAWPADYIFVEAADAAAAGDGEEPQADAARPQAQVKLAGGGGSKDDPKWLIRISATELTGGKDPVPVGVNGHIVVIQRNMEVEVPHRYIEALRNAVRVSVAQDPRTQEFTLSAFTNYPLEIIERPSRDEIEAFRERTKDLVLA